MGRSLAVALLLAAAAAQAAPRHYRRFPGQGQLRAAASASPTDVTAPKLDYYGGKVIPSAQIVAVFWGAAGPPGFEANVEQFYRDFLVSPAYLFLSEYDTTIKDVNGNPGTNQVIGAGTFSKGITITPGTSAATITGAQLEAELALQIDQGVLPPPADNILYAVHLAPGISVRDTQSRSCVDYCAYHSSFTHGAAVAYYALLPDHSPPSACAGCGESTDWFSNLSASVSHEVAEAVTDADVGNDLSACGPAWCDPATADPESVHGEIGDICESGAVTEAPFTGQDGTTQWVTQRLWSNAAQACVVSSQTAVKAALTPATAVRTGATLDFTVQTSAPAQGAAPQVKLSTFTLPAGVSATFDRAQVTAGQQTALHLQFTGSAPDAFSFGVAAEAGVSQALLSAAVTTVDFIVTAPGAPLAIAAGGSASVQLTTALSPADAASSPLTASSTQPGFTAAIAPAAQTGGPATLVLTAARGVPSGAATVAVTLSNGARAHPLAVPVLVDGDDAQLTAPAGLSVSQGSSNSFVLVTQTTHGQPQQLALSVTGLPGGVTAVLDPPAVQSGATAKLTLTATSTALPQSTALTLIHAGPLQTQSQQVPLTVAAGGCSSAGAASPWLLALALFCAGRALSRRRAESPARSASAA